MSASESLMVYVVDDEKVISETLTIILKNHGFAAHGHTSPAEVLNRCSQAPPDVLLSDINMPGMTGVELAVEIRKRCPCCIVVFFSAEPLLLAAIADELKIEQPFACLNKPIHPETLLRTIGFLSALQSNASHRHQVVIQS